MYAGLQELASTLTTLMKARELQEGKGKHICLGTGTTDVSRMMEEQKNEQNSSRTHLSFLMFIDPWGWFCHRSLGI